MDKPKGKKVFKETADRSDLILERNKERLTVKPTLAGLLKEALKPPTKGTP